MGSLSSHVNNKQVLSNSFHNAHTIKCKNCESTNVIQQTYQICQSNDTYILTKCPVCNKNTEYLKLKTKIIYSKCFEYNKYQNEMFTDEIKKYLTKQFENTFNYCNKNDNKFLMSLQKGVYPYEYVNDWDKFDETTIPFKEFFLARNGYSDFRHVKNVFKQFKHKNLGEYHDCYLQLDVVQLADTFQNFRKTAHKTYRMDIAYFVTLPSYTWGACLKFTKVKLEKLVDIEIINMYADGKRGDITHAITRYAKANDKYMPNYDPKKPSSNLMYEDGNNLYG